jgi:hypothetical protein
LRPLLGAFGIVWLGIASPALAQIPTRPFVAVGVVAERDPTDFFYGSDDGLAARLAVGAPLSGRHGLRVEWDVPRWRTLDTASSSPVFCAASAGCLGGVGFVPAYTATHSAVRSVSYSVLYALHLPATGRLRFALLAGGSLEQREFRSSGSFDELGARGEVLRHTVSSDDRTRFWFAGVVGFEGDVRVTRHLSVVPELRFHAFPYPLVSILRVGTAVRWRF